MFCWGKRVRDRCLVGEKSKRIDVQLGKRVKDRCLVGEKNKRQMFSWGKE